jgi:hypothetical protein
MILAFPVLKDEIIENAKYPTRIRLKPIDTAQIRQQYRYSFFVIFTSLSVCII